MDKTLIAGQYDSSHNSRIVWSEGISYAVTNGHKDGMPKIIYEVINPDVSGAEICRTIKATYHKVSTANLMRGGTFGATGVMEIGEPKMMQLVGDRDNPSVSVKDIAFTVCSSPMSDRGQVVVEPTETSKTNNHSSMIEGELHMEDGCLVDEEGRQYRIRKLTPREVGRLMDVSDEDIDRIEATGLSRAAQYKMYGNSICVGMMFHLFRKLFIETDNENQQLSLF